VGLILALGYPLLRFLRFRIRPQPRVVYISPPLSVTGFHAEPNFFLFAPPDPRSGDVHRAWAVSRVCTHLGCRVNYREHKGLIECPCHSSRFRKNGERISGPATRGLAVFPVEIVREHGEIKTYRVTLPS